MQHYFQASSIQRNEEYRVGRALQLIVCSPLFHYHACPGCLGRDAVESVTLDKNRCKGNSLQKDTGDWIMIWTKNRDWAGYPQFSFAYCISPVHCWLNVGAKDAIVSPSLKDRGGLHLNRFYFLYAGKLDTISEYVDVGPRNLEDFRLLLAKSLLFDPFLASKLMGR